MTVDLSIVMPVYNEIELITDAIADVDQDIVAQVDTAELIVVDDGSHDGTEAVLHRLTATYPWLRVLRQENRGHGPALLAGVAQSRGAWVLLLDADREIGLGCFPDIWRDRDAAGAFLGMRFGRSSGWLRRLATAGLRTCLLVTLGARTRDANCPFKLVQGELCRRALGSLPRSCLTPSALLAGYLVRLDAPTRWVEVPYASRHAGRGGFKPLRLFRFALVAGLQIPADARKLRRLARTCPHPHA